jgi:aspartate carbamoyltransferase regulatory subunit
VGKKLIAKFEEQCLKKKLNLIIFYAPKFNENTIEFYKSQKYSESEFITEIKEFVKREELGY